MLFFFNDPATTEIYTLSLHVALPISRRLRGTAARQPGSPRRGPLRGRSLQNSPAPEDRKSTRLNSTHSQISYAVFCLKKTNKGPILMIRPAAVGTAIQADNV